MNIQSSSPRLQAAGQTGEVVVVHSVKMSPRCYSHVIRNTVILTLCFLLSAADLGELLQRSYGHQDPGRLHGGEADGSGPHHRGRPRPDLQR